MKAKIAILILSILFTACRSKAVTLAVAERHADSVASLRSVSTRGVNVFRETETIIMRQDSTGRLVPVAHDIIRRTEKSTENVSTADTAHFDTKDKESIIVTKETQPAAKKTHNGRDVAFAIGFLLLFTAFVMVLAIYLLKLWKSKD